MAIEFKFKSVGKTRSENIATAEAAVSPTIPVGIKTPIRFGKTGESIFTTNNDVVTQIADNLRNLIQTNHGERLGLYDFGANLEPLMAELQAQSEDFENEAMLRIKTAVTKYMPFVQLTTFSTVIDHNQNQVLSNVQLNVGWGVPKLGVTNKQLKIKLFIM